MTVIKAALLGFGTVGQGVYEAIQTHSEQLKKLLGASVSVEAVLVKDITKERPGVPRELLTDNFNDILSIPDLQIVFEAIVGVEPALGYLKQSIAKGCHIVTANKVLFAQHGNSLQQEASRKGVTVGFEATTAGGAPVIRTIKELLRVNKISRIEGILNGTSNYILTLMREENYTFEAALKLSQEKGYAEADPENDVEGYDALNKLLILSELAFGEKPDLSVSGVEGITRITLEDIQKAKKAGQRYRHLVSAEMTEHGVAASIKPVLLSEDHPLYSVDGVLNAVAITASLAGTVTIKGAGAGKLPTASAMIEDAAALSGKLQTVQPLSARSLFAG
ncbi:homoserine dehydrogenase [Fictibacillus iocasae]|uniref:Homoserine dehydrogenase n=1 Tax=Fictibacillus iocasae TaxID=2715437 RepID=A0ABW2NNH5_9BACL